MKRTKQTALLIIFSLFFFTVSCQSMGPQGSNCEYMAGTHAGKSAAHEDVLHGQGKNYRMSDISAIRNNTNKHLKEMQDPASDDFIKGFKWGYKSGFRDAVDTYNSGG